MSAEDVQQLTDLSEIAPSHIIPDAEVRSWVEMYPTLEDWLSFHYVEPALYVQTQAFMGWLDIMWSETNGLYAGGMNGMSVQPCMKFIWINSENVEMEEIRSLLFQAAKTFHRDIGCCLVYSSVTRNNEAERVLIILEESIRRVSLPRAMQDFALHVGSQAPMPPAHAV